MKTFYEEIMKRDYSNVSEYQKDIIAKMDEAEIIDIQNISEYFYLNELNTLYIFAEDISKIFQMAKVYLVNIKACIGGIVKCVETRNME